MRAMYKHAMWAIIESSRSEQLVDGIVSGAVGALDPYSPGDVYMDAADRNRDLPLLGVNFKVTPGKKKWFTCAGCKAPCLRFRRKKGATYTCDACKWDRKNARKAKKPVAPRVRVPAKCHTCKCDVMRFPMTNDRKKSGGRYSCAPCAAKKRWKNVKAREKQRKPRPKKAT